MPPLHADEIDSSVLAGHNIRRTDPLAFLNDTTVAAATNEDDLIASIEASRVYADQEWKEHAIRALRMAVALGDLDDAKIAAATTVESLVAHTQAVGDGLYQSMTIE